MQAPEYRCPKPQAVLTKDKVIEIFKISLKGSVTEKPNASLVAREYGVHEKTIRDIWTGRTWHDETQPLAIDREPRQRAKTGRPLGCKDSVPRRRKANHLMPSDGLEFRLSVLPTEQMPRSAKADLNMEGGTTISSIPCGLDLQHRRIIETGNENPLPESKRRRLLPEPMDQWQPSLSLLAVPALPVPPAHLGSMAFHCPPDTNQSWIRDCSSSYIPSPHCPPPPVTLTPSPPDWLFSARCAGAASGVPSVLRSRLDTAGAAASLRAFATQPPAQPPYRFCGPAPPLASSMSVFPCVAPPSISPCLPPVWAADPARVSRAGPPAMDNAAVGGLLLTAAALRQRSQAHVSAAAAAAATMPFWGVFAASTPPGPMGGPRYGGAGGGGGTLCALSGMKERPMGGR